MSRLKLLFLGLFLLNSVISWADNPHSTISNQQAMLALQKIVAKRAPYSPELASEVRNIVFQLGKNIRYKHQVTTLLNMYQGYGDLLFSKSFPPFKEDVPNFSQVCLSIFRGGQPNQAGFLRLKNMGVTTVINLRLEDSSEEAVLKELGMKSFHIPMPDTTPPTIDQIQTFLGILRDLKGEKAFVHCAAGKNRTSAMVAAWRIENGMLPEDALKEALKFGLHPDFLSSDRIQDFILRYNPGKPVH